MIQTFRVELCKRLELSDTNVCALNPHQVREDDPAGLAQLGPHHGDAPGRTPLALARSLSLSLTHTHTHTRTHTHTHTHSGLVGESTGPLPLFLTRLPCRNPELFDQVREDDPAGLALRGQHHGDAHGRARRRCDDAQEVLSRAAVPLYTGCLTWEKLLSRNVERFQGGLVFKAHRLVYHSTLGSRVVKKKKSLA